MNDEKWRPSTKAIHAGEPRPGIEGAVTLPIFQSSTFEYFGSEPSIKYIRNSNTPTHDALNEKLAALEGAERALVFSSGMAAIANSLLAIVGPKENLLSQNSLYGGTYQFFAREFLNLGREVSYFRLGDLSRLEESIRPNTKAIYVESLSNPLLEVPDFENIIAVAKKRGLLTVIDNTFPSPVNFNPISLGFDVVLHSATKYLNGHTDILAGCAMGSGKLLTKIGGLSKILGASLDPHACFLLLRGIKTLYVRMAKQNESALAVARALSSHPRVTKVAYPGLETHPYHAAAKKYFRGYGGMLSFEVKGTVADADAFLKRLKIPFVAPSLGGVESLVTRPAITSHYYMSPEERKREGISDSLIRMSVGLEDPQDLIDDFSQALK